jgi:hypothetical protein
MSNAVAAAAPPPLLMRQRQHAGAALSCFPEGQAGRHQHRVCGLQRGHHAGQFHLNVLVSDVHVK